MDGDHPAPPNASHPSRLRSGRNSGFSNYPRIISEIMANLPSENKGCSCLLLDALDYFKRMHTESEVLLSNVWNR